MNAAIYATQSGLHPLETFGGSTTVRKARVPPCVNDHIGQFRFSQVTSRLTWRLKNHTSLDSTTFKFDELLIQRE